MTTLITLKGIFSPSRPGLLQIKNWTSIFAVLFCVSVVKGYLCWWYWLRAAFTGHRAVAWDNSRVTGLLHGSCDSGGTGGLGWPSTGRPQCWKDIHYWWFQFSFKNAAPETVLYLRYCFRCTWDLCRKWKQMHSFSSELLLIVNWSSWIAGFCLVFVARFDVLLDKCSCVLHR